MILILSHEHLDEPTNDVIDWLSYYNEDFIRLNGDDFSFNSEFTININHKTIQTNQGVIVSENDINVVWYRRWIKPEEKEIYFEKYKNLKYSNQEVALIEKYNKYLEQEKRTYTNGIFSVFKDKFWIPKPHNARGNINKLDVLLRAKDNGLNIPNTIVTSSKKEVVAFFKAHKSIITKPIYEADTIRYKQKEIPLLTSIVSKDNLDKFPELFFPSLFQENIEKQFEIRTFIHREKAYSMAIFSQNDTQTSVDFRNYNYDKPNRYVPFILPNEIEIQLLKLLEELNLNTGSIDLIYSKTNKYVFLEINPVGQFGMVSINCN